MNKIARKTHADIIVSVLTPIILVILVWNTGEWGLPVFAEQELNEQIYLPQLSRNYQPPRVSWGYRGASIAGYWEYAYAAEGNAYDTIDELRNLGVNSVTILTTWYQDGFTTSQIAPGPMTPRDQDLIALIQYAHSQGLLVVLKPHIDPLIGWRGDIDPDNSVDWFARFQEFILYYAQIAEEQGVETLIIGTEYDKLVQPPHIDYWAGIIQAVRLAYHGNISYAATEISLFEGNIPDWFWQSLDMVSLTLYHEFSPAKTPEVSDIVSTWDADNVLLQLKQFHDRYNIPVLIAEVGYRSIDFAGVESWRTEGPNYDSDRGINLSQSIDYNGEGQANLYEGLFQVLGNQEWIAGIFMWQYVPNGGCNGIVRGGVGNTDYSVLGKPAALVIHDWFGRTSSLPNQWVFDSTNPKIHSFEYEDSTFVPYGWQVTTSGQVTFTVDSVNIPPLPNATRSLIVDTHTPLENGRFEQMDYYFCDGDRNWNELKSLELWVRTDMQSGDPEGCELAVGLIDGRSREREYWQSSQWLPRQPVGVSPDGWRKIQIALAGSPPPERNPWRHPTDFVIPEWDKIINQQLDLIAIRGVRIKTLTTDESTTPDCQVWLGPMQASAEQVEIIQPPYIPIIDSFEYHQAATAQRVWQSPGNSPSTVEFYPDTSRLAPGTESKLSLHIHTSTPCVNPRFEQTTNFLLGGGVDLSPYNSLEIWAGGDLVNSTPYGGEFSIVLEDIDGEFWQSTRWLGRTIQGKEYIDIGLEPARFSLLSYDPDYLQNPWLHPADFVLTPSGNTSGNKVLDRQWIRSITLKTLTTNEYCQEYPTFDVWVDQLVASKVIITPPVLLKLPTIDNFEYKDSETARLVWKWASSGSMNITTDSSIHAPESTSSIHISTNAPENSSRYAQAYNIFIPGVQDFNPYDTLRFWARTAPVAPWGGELSIEMIETDPMTGQEETWRNTRWYGNSDGSWIEIELISGASVPVDPWKPEYKNVFVVPTDGQYVDGSFNLSHITEIRIIALTTDTNYPEFNLWVDEMKVH